MEEKKQKAINLLTELMLEAAYTISAIRKAKLRTQVEGRLLNFQGFLDENQKQVSEFIVEDLEP